MGSKSILDVFDSDSLQTIGLSPRAKSVPEVLTCSLEVMYERILHVLYGPQRCQQGDLFSPLLFN